MASRLSAYAIIVGTILSPALSSPALAHPKGACTAAWKPWLSARSENAPGGCVVSASVETLIARPESFDRAAVTVPGVINLGHEADKLYDDKEAWELRL